MKTFGCKIGSIESLRRFSAENLLDADAGNHVEARIRLPPCNSS
jgi:hypothetical protein